MILIDDWKKVLEKAWSVRLGLAAGFCTAADNILPFVADDIPKGLFLALALIFGVAGFMARFLKQEDFDCANKST